MKAAAIGVDIGGTFTDIIVATQDGGLHRAKVLSSPPDFGRAVLEGLTGLARSAGLDLGAAVTLVHGTTVATNAILEGRGARTGLVTTRGFRDVLELGRMRRPSLYDLFWEKPEPLVPRRLRLELDQRIAADGDVEREPSDDELQAVAERFRDAGVNSARGVPAQLLPQPRRGTAHRRAPLRARRRQLRHGVRGHHAGDPRVRTQQHRGRQRLCAPGHGSLRRGARNRTRGRRRHRPAAHHAVGRRPRDQPARTDASRPADRVRARRRRDRGAGAHRAGSTCPTPSPSTWAARPRRPR